MSIKTLMASVGSTLIAALAVPAVAIAASTVVVTPANQQGWSTADTRPGGSVNFVYDNTAPGSGDGALKLTTDSTTAAKAQYLHSANTKLTNVNNLSYYTKQNSASFNGGDPSYQLPVCLGGLNSPATTENPTGCTGFTTFVYEPYQNGSVTPGIWQQWDVDSGQFWSSGSFSDGDAGKCDVTAGGGGAPFYTLAALKMNCPNAVVVGFGVNIGSNNPSYNVETDLVNFDGTTYNFEVTNTPTDKNQCKNNGYQNFTDENGETFDNQGQCTSFVNRGNSRNKVTNRTNVTVSNTNTQNSTVRSGNANVRNNATGGNANSGNANSSNSNTSTTTVTVSNQNGGTVETGEF